MSGPADPHDLNSHKWRNVDQNTDAAVRYLDLLTSLIEGIKRRATEKLDLTPGQRVLELGCGAGRDAEYLAQLVAPGGRVVATDLSAELVAQATARVAALGLALEYRVADAQNLPFADASFDAARVERMLQHVPDPARAVREMVRVVRPGGRVVALEPDWESVCVAGSNVAVLRALRRVLADDFHAHGGIGRDTPQLFQQASCHDIHAEGAIFTTQALALADTVLSLAKAIEAAVAHGWISEADSRAWWEEVAARDAAGAFYASICGTIVVARVA